MTLTGCAGSNNAVLRRDLPDPPAWVEPVVTPDPKPGDDALAVAARERAAKAQANSRITEFKGWYLSVRDGYAAP